MTANLRTCPPKTRSFHRGLRCEFAGISARLATISCQSRNQAVIRLDFQRDVADTPGNTPTASLLELVPCHFSDVHKRRVFTEQIARFELQRITAAPPLMISNGQHANIGRLLFCLFKTASNALANDGKLDQQHSLLFWEAAIQ